jgi:DNA polymerase elongation subunit (family B)
MATHADADEVLFGWDPTLGIVSVWADDEGQAVVWRRVDGALVCERARYQPWVLATSLADLAHLGAELAEAGTPGAAQAKVRYRRLAGEEGSFRYLLAARRGRALTSAIVEGAARRLGGAPRAFGELGGYHRLGAVEQYLAQTGRVCFRGLRFEDLHRMQIDLETTGLDPDAARIFLVAVRDSRGLETTIEAPSAGEERGLVEALCALVRERDPDVLENHNLLGFDLPFLARRAEILGVPLGLGRAGGPLLLERSRLRATGYGGRRERFTVAGRELLDTLDAVRRHDFVARDLPSHGLKDVARRFGVAAPDRVYLRGAEIHATYARDPALVRRYALGDVAEVDALSQRLLRAPFALAGMAPRRFERLASAGPATGVLEPILLRAYLHARTAPPGPEREDAALGPHVGGALHLFATGIAERVVKCDIASLYPSLMCAYRIGPESDRLGALLHVVERVRTLRLAHKAAAKKGGADAGHHEAMQAAMKLLINSAYGYMGAGSIAMFADRRAADEVTRRGREILDQVLDALRARGVALIEADTDGVYFAVPARFTEADERALVAEVAAALPAGIQLEYEGRYRAMFSHEVKNYALLGYDGEVVLRGGALRSSRSEPFGERFLRDALRRVMQGDVPGVRAAFVEVASALAARALPASALATRQRLTKTREAYLATRAAHREAAYEALLAAGRASWAPGERVRHYRAQGGASVWLPDEDQGQRGDEDARDYDAEHYLRLLVDSYASRLRKAFAPADFTRVFQLGGQAGLFDGPLAEIAPIRIRCAEG